MTNTVTGNMHALFIRDEFAIEIGLNKASLDQDQLLGLNTMMFDVARAIRAVVYRSENDGSVDFNFALGHVPGLADTIMLLSQLQEAILLDMKLTNMEVTPRASCSRRGDHACS